MYPESFTNPDSTKPPCRFATEIDGKRIKNLGRITNAALNAVQRNPNDKTEINTSSRRIARQVLSYLDSADKSNAQYLFTAPSGKNTWDTTFNDYFGEKYKEDKYSDLGGLKEPDFEAINELNPDLIIISGRQADMYDKFAEIATTVYLSVDGSDYLNDFSRNLDVLGKIFGKEDFVKENLDNLTKQMDEVKAMAQEKNVNALTTMVSEGNLSVFSDKSRFGLIYNQLGITNKDETIEESNHGQQVTFEYLAEQNPEYIFVVDKGSAIGGEGTAKALFDNDLIKSTDAYKNDKIVYLDSAAWYVVAGGLDSTQTMINNVKDALK